MEKLPLWLQSICGEPGLSQVCLPLDACPVDQELADMKFEDRSKLFLALNKEQFAVLKAGLTTSRLTLVQGPPGTGKSRLQAICTEVRIQLACCLNRPCVAFVLYSVYFKRQ